MGLSNEKRGREDKEGTLFLEVAQMTLLTHQWQEAANSLPAQSSENCPAVSLGTAAAKFVRTQPVSAMAAVTVGSFVLALAFY